MEQFELDKKTLSLLKQLYVISENKNEFDEQEFIEFLINNFNVYDNKKVFLDEVRKKIMELSYSEKLKFDEWKEKREYILYRDGLRCVLCDNDSKTLHCHHKKYINGTFPWEYDDNLLITLCEDCHAKFHNIEPKKEEIIYIKGKCKKDKLIQNALENQSFTPEVID